MTIKDLKEIFTNVDDIEVYHATSYGNNTWHTDTLKWVEEYNENAKVIRYDIMNEEEYSKTILANCGEEADFGLWYGNKNAHILCVIVEKEDE